jgi:hypothetical protein
MALVKKGEAVEARELHLELILGKRVVDVDGKRVGRIQEMRAERGEGGGGGGNMGREVEERQGELVVVEYLIGPAAILERLSAWHLMAAAMRLLRVRRFTGGYKVPWHLLDLSDPDNPRLRCSLDRLGEWRVTGG